MTNRYAVEGIVRDMLAGKAVALAGHTRAETRKTFDAVVGYLEAKGIRPSRVTRANGAERVELGLGRVVVITADAKAGRGHSLDVLVLVDGLRTLSDHVRDDFMASVLPAGATRPGGLEVIRLE